MMESSNLNLDLHHQEDFHGSSSSLALQGWNQDLMLNSAEFPHGALPSSRNFMRTTNNGMPMVQELGFQWTPSGHDQGYMMNTNQSPCSSSSSHQTLGFPIPKNNIKEELSIASTINLHDYSLMPFHGSFSNVFPSENVSGSVLQSFCPNPLGMDLHALDLLASARFGRTMSQPLFDGYGLGQLQEQAQAQVSTSYHKAPHSVSGVTEAKRSNSLDGGTSQPASLTKKPRPPPPPKKKKRKMIYN
ncbi:uncharacterized protein LOC109839227 [Asparagus officinalis]|uniref:uncharacterized protein LOC109839227 n=1 Tax=Asparagus officinalis TaxID=4686 RepID=UPI00098E7F96|nr:uncharacterized protein LOC109839227 [Asparagus officinalis]